MKPFTRIDNPAYIDKALVETELKLGKEVILQFEDTSYTDKILADINELCLVNDENLCIRFYGHYSEPFDCNVLQKIPHVKCLYIDCMISANNLQQVKELLNLRSLCLGIFEIEDPEILSASNLKDLTELIIDTTKTKAFNLGHLSSFKKLKSLRISGHTKNIEAIGDLSELETLTLYAIKKVPLHFINQLKQLKKLEILLGGRDHLNEIALNTIEHLDITWVRGLHDLSCLANFPQLKSLNIEDEIQLATIAFHTIHPHLTEVKIYNCKKLETIGGLKNLPQLHTLLVNQTNINFDKFMEQELPKSLKTLEFHTYKSKVDKEIQAVIESKGYVYR